MARHASRLVGLERELVVVAQLLPHRHVALGVDDDLLAPLDGDDARRAAGVAAVVDEPRQATLERRVNHGVLCFVVIIFGRREGVTGQEKGSRELEATQAGVGAARQLVRVFANRSLHLQHCSIFCQARPRFRKVLLVLHLARQRERCRCGVYTCTPVPPTSACRHRML